MSYKDLQLSPQASTDVIRVVRMRTATQDSWNAPVSRLLNPGLLNPGLLNQGSGDSGSVQTWFDDEYDLIEDSRPAAISGLALSIAFSATFWAGVAWIVTRVLR
jgi:hypothetical protein